MTIEEWIQELEEEEESPIDFYRKLLRANTVIKERLSQAEDEGVDLDDLEEEED